MKKKIYLLLITILLSSQIFASGGSLYSRYGIGDLYFSSSAMSLSLAGPGTSLISGKYVNISNPATLYDIKNTKFGFGLNANIAFIDDGVNKAQYSHVRFSGFQIAFPIKESYGIGFIFGLTPYSIVNYEVKNIVDNDVFDDYLEEYQGSGGISKLFFGISYLLPLDIAIGATFDYYSGNISYKSSFTYADSSNLTNPYYILDNKYKGLGSNIGIESPDLAPIFGFENISNFRIGITYEISGALKTDSTILAFTSLGEKSFESGVGETKIPQKLSFGLNLTINENYLLVFDYLYQPWSKFKQNGYESGYLKDLSRYSIGFEIGKQAKRFASFWELIKYRGGLSYEQSHYQLFGVAIDQFGVHAGISFPIGMENTIDIGLMYAIRGTTNSNLSKENILQTSFSLSFGELWFERRDR